MNKKTQTTGFIIFMLIFVAVPLIMMFSGFYYLDYQKAAAEKDKNIRAIKNITRQFEIFRNSEKFICTDFNKIFLSKRFSFKNLENELIERAKQVKQSYKCSYVIYRANENLEKIVNASFQIDNEYSWIMALRALTQKLQNPEAELPEQEYKAAADIFGPQLNWFTLRDPTHTINPGLVWADAKMQKPLLYPLLINDYTLCVLVDKTELTNNSRLVFEFNRLNKNPKILFSLCENNKVRHINAPSRYKQQLENVLVKPKYAQTTRIETESLIIFHKFIKNGLTAAVALIKQPVKISLKSPLRLICILFFVLFAVILSAYAYKVAFKHRADDTSIKVKLFFLFLFANLMPLSVLFCIGTDYLEQKRNNMLLEKQSEIILTLQDLDEKMQFEYARLNAKAQKAIEGFSARIYNSPLTNEILTQFNKDLGKQENWRVVCIASTGTTIGTEGGLYDDVKHMSDYYINRRAKDEFEFFRKVGQVFLSLLNHTIADEKTVLELELAIESLVQKSLVQVMADFLKNSGSFADMGIGHNIHPGIVNIVYKKNLERGEYLVFTLKKKQSFQYDFLSKNIPRLNRNSKQIRIIGFSKRVICIPKDAYGDKEINKYAHTLTSYPSDELKFITYEAKPHLASGFAGRNASEYKLIGLCPLEAIDKIISEKKQRLYVFALLSLAITCCLSIALALSFIVPLNKLMQGANAIEGKIFSHRLPNLGSDEFGSLGAVFNNVMLSLEELSAASAVQNQLLPHEKIEIPGFDIFGKAVSLTELSGDYFDYFAAPPQGFGVLLGDVAGHGVGAALIMAMTKAAVLQSEDIAPSPLLLVNRLHKLILAAKTKKQRRIMTLQYLFLDREKNKALYSNAGACFPVLVKNHGETAEEITLSAPVLGGFKRAVYSETEINLESGDAIIFYTDGLAEAIGPSGQALGYNGIKQICLKNYNTNAERFYNGIYSDYLAYINNQTPTDDVTIVVLTRA